MEPVIVIIAFIIGGCLSVAAWICLDDDDYKGGKS